MHQYECPQCGSKVELSAPAEPGQQVRCTVCRSTFVPRAEVISFQDDEPVKPKGKVKAARPSAARPAGKAPVAAVKAVVVKEEDDDNDVTPYGVVRESEAEKRLAARNKPTFTDPRDKFKRSARGPAAALLVLPSNLLVAEGALTCIAGLVIAIVGAWPLIFTDAPAADTEVAEAIVWIFGGIVAFLYGGIICLGASKMQSLESYAWSLVGAILGILPLLAGIFALVALRDPRVIAGFEEIEGAIDDYEDEEEEEDEDDEEEDEEEEDEDDDE